MKPTAFEPARRGIALIVTLGFLAVIAILAVAFAITMRVERLAARSFADGVRARQLAHVGLARAMADIHGHADANSLLYPQWTGDSFPSSGATGPANFLTGSATNYIPGSVLNGARSRASAVRWVDVTSGTNLIGRYAYLAVNCSGLLDPNADYAATGSATPRKYGLSPYELAYNSALLGELGTGAANLMPGRTGAPRSKAWRRAESVPDLWVAGYWGYGTRPFIGNPPVSNFFPFSYFPQGFRGQGGNIEEPINIAVAAPSLNVNDIRNRLQSMGLSAANANTVARNLVDYLDGDFTPHDLDTFSAEPVPMLNEVVLENIVTYDSGSSTWSNRIRMRVELFYPFANPATASGFTLQFTVQPVGGDFVIAPQSETVNVPNMTFDTPSEIWVSPAREFTWTYASTNTPAMPTQFQITGLSVRRSGTEVDRVRTPINIPWGTHFHASPIGASIPTGSSWAVNDPRINWDWDNQWNPPVETKVASPGGSLNAMNPKATAMLGQPDQDGHRAMYARNGNGNIEVPGELGFLLYDANRPWQTIPLHGSDALAVLDHFTTNTNAFRTGLVNLNSENRNVLAQVFFDTPLERWPGESGAPRVSVAQATALATAIYNAGGANQYTNVSHIARAGAGIDSALAGFDRLQRKAAIRNSSMLLGTRQNIYTIIITAQSVVDANNDGTVQNDEVVGEQRAVAVVWRDPYRVGGNYNTFVRFFRWLDD